MKKRFWSVLFTLTFSVSSYADWSATPLTIDQRNLFNPALPQVALSSIGRKVAVWQAVSTSSNLNNTLIVQGSTLELGGTSWATPVQLSQTGVTAITPKVGVDDSGNAIAIWQGNTASNSATNTGIIRYAIFQAKGMNWILPTSNTISSPTENSTTPVLAVNGLGKVIAVWAGKTSSDANFSIKTSQFDLSAADLTKATWTTPVTISVPGQAASNPQVSIDSKGNAVAVWLVFKGPNFIVQSSTFIPLS